jgi:5-methylcytosine-specific restriction protein B
MRTNIAYQVYDLFNEFIETCILNGNSLLTNDSDIFSVDVADVVIDRFIINGLVGGDNFETKIRQQFEGVDHKTLLFFAHANWLWAMPPSDITQWRKGQVVRIVMNDENITLNQDKFPAQGIGSAGLWHRQNKHAEITFIILMIKQLLLLRNAGKLNTIDEGNNLVEKICLKRKYDWEGDRDFIDKVIWDMIPKGKLAMYNILPHLCKPSNYEPIVSDNHKYRIVNTFQSLLFDASEGITNSNTDEKIFSIRQKIAEYWNKPDFSFYDNKLTEIWNYYSGISDFDAFQAIQYKKAVIFYGPPGTSKTHSAELLAGNLIYQHYFTKPENIRRYFKDNPEIKKDRIHHLQLHPNYSYEDFIGGTQFVNGKTEKKMGYLLNLLEKVKNDEYPHVLILDEINRIDLARLFGELFSALEKRGKDINTSVGDFIINVPENFYVIGTMNEIDFSLERIDFALRRRFVWFFFGYNQETLKSIILEKCGELKSNIKHEDIDAYIAKCSALNNAIEGIEDLGKQYQIGHTFFAEIVDIHESFRKIEGLARLRLLRKNASVKILWDISIKPMLEAFLGNMDRTTKEDHINKLSQILLP